jgi:hypothetical protein
VIERGATFADLLAVDAQLVKAGHHPLTPFWGAELERFYSGEARTFVGRVGRGGAKSHTSAKVALTETLFGQWSIPPGERHYWAFVSTNKDEAAQRLLLLQSFLRALKVEFDTNGDTIALRSMPRGFRVFAAQVGAVSGFRCYGFSADELAKWQSGSDYSNPAQEVCASLNAMTVTHPGARRLLVSSPFALDDYHAEAFNRGNSDDQCVAFAPTWIANPSLTEAATRKTETDPRIWAREYAAEPGNTESQALDADDIAAAFALAAPARLPRARFIVLDPADLRGSGDRFTYAIGHEHYDGSLAIKDVNGSNAVKFDQMVDTIVRLARDHSITRIFSDQREAMGLASRFEKEGFTFTAYNWTEPSKHEAVTLLRRAMRERKLALTEHTDLRRELLGLKSRLTPGGRELFPLNGRDFAALLVTIMHGVAEKAIRCEGALPEFTMQDVPAGAWDQLSDLLTNDMQDGMSGADRYRSSRR